MRAVFLAHLDGATLGPGDLITIDGRAVHHLVNVARLTIKEKLLVLNGKGAKIIVVLKSISRQELTATVETINYDIRQETLQLAVCLPKKEAWEEVLRVSVELGVSDIFPVFSKYAQRFLLNEDRIKRIFESACIQANNPNLPRVHSPCSLSEIQARFEYYDNILYFSSHGECCGGQDKIAGKCLFLIGPEGGLAEEEEGDLRQSGQVKWVHLPTYILRVPTAVCAAAGMIVANRI